VVGVEDRVRQVGAAAAQRLGDQRVQAALEGGQLGQRLAGLGEPGPQVGEVGACRRLVERDADMLRRDAAQVGAGRARTRDHGLGAVAGLDRQRVEGLRGEQPAAERAQPLGQDRGVGRHALGDALQALRTVVDGVHAGDHRQQHLRGADVGGRLLAPDVLLARLQRQAVAGVAVRIDAGADEAARHLALELVAAGQVGRVRTAGTHRHAETLRAADRDVGAELARWLEQRQRQQVGGDDERRLLRVRLLDKRRQVVDQPGRRRVLGDDGEAVVRRQQRRHRADQHLQSERLAARADDLDRLRVAVGGDDQRVGPGLHAAPRQRHRLGRRRGLVEHRRAGHRQAGEVGHHGLEVDQRLQPALADLGLVGRVRRVPGRVLEDVAQDDARRVGAVVALADEAPEHLVLRRDGLQLGQCLRLANRRRQVHRPRARDRRRHHGLDQRRARRRPDHRQHVRLSASSGPMWRGANSSASSSSASEGRVDISMGFSWRGSVAARRSASAGRVRASSAARRRPAGPSAGRTPPSS
jgi:hypothetical protein